MNSKLPREKSGKDQREKTGKHQTSNLEVPRKKSTLKYKYAKRDIRLVFVAPIIASLHSLVVVSLFIVFDAFLS